MSYAWSYTRTNRQTNKLSNEHTSKIQILASNKQASKHACIHTYVHTYMHTCMHAYINTYIFVVVNFNALVLWHRQAILESKGDNLSSSTVCRIRTPGLWNRISGTLNVRCKLTELSRIKLKRLNLGITSMLLGRHVLGMMFRYLVFMAMGIKIRKVVLRKFGKFGNAFCGVWGGGWESDVGRIFVL